LLETLDDIPSYSAMMQHVMKTEFWHHAMLVDEFTSGVGRAWTALYGKEPDFMARFLTRSLFLPNYTKIELAGYYRALIDEIPKHYCDMNWESDKIDLYSRVRSASVLGKLKYAVVDKNIMGRTFVSLMYLKHKTLESRCRYDAELAATKIIVACNLFARDTGRKPLTLDELVGSPGTSSPYLTSVPLDPFDGAPFRYNAELGVIYSVNKSLTDLGGTDDGSRGRSPSIDNPWRGKNAIFRVWEE